MATEVMFKSELLGEWTPVKCCCIFTGSRSVGLQKLMEIALKKEKAGITFRRRDKDHGYISFDDGEDWRIINPKHNLNGILWDKCFVDAYSVSISSLRDIKTRARNKDIFEDNLVYFNW